MRIYSFPPIANKNATTLILGSMPGRASLAANQYYAHAQNAFWPIMTVLLDMETDASYQTKIRALQNANIALWDVLQSCIRPGSLDAHINRHTEVPNDFAAFFKKHPHIQQVFFNGTQAEILFKRHVLSKIELPNFLFGRLPSTSPANAAMKVAQKLAKWRMILNKNFN